MNTKDLLTRKFKIWGFSYSLNAADHPPRPDLAFSGFSEPQQGRGQVQRLCLADVLGFACVFLLVAIILVIVDTSCVGTTITV